MEGGRTPPPPPPFLTSSLRGVGGALWWGGGGRGLGSPGEGDGRDRRMAGRLVAGSNDGEGREGRGGI